MPNGKGYTHDFLTMLELADPKERPWIVKDPARLTQRDPWFRAVSQKSPPIAVGGLFLRSNIISIKIEAGADPHVMGSKPSNRIGL